VFFPSSSVTGRSAAGNKLRSAESADIFALMESDWLPCIRLDPFHEAMDGSEVLYATSHFKRKS
jgi:hypothetical protein